MGNEAELKTAESYIEELLSRITNLHDQIGCVKSANNWLREENARLSAEQDEAKRKESADQIKARHAIEGLLEAFGEGDPCRFSSRQIDTIRFARLILKAAN